MHPRIVAAASEAVFWTTRRLQLTIPSILARGEEFCLRLTAFAADGLPSDDYGREIVFEQTPDIEGLPRSVAFSPVDGGHLTVEGLRAVGTSRARVVARPEGCPSPVPSNPAWIFDEPPYRMYWGDPHEFTLY